MNEKESYWILGNGEEYIEPVEKSGGPNNKDYRFTYEQVRLKLKTDIRTIKETARNISPDYRMNELVLCLRILPEFLAKSYYPQTITNLSGLKDIGSRSWNTMKPDKKGKGDIQAISKLIFLRATNEGLNGLEARLDAPESKVSKAWIEDVRQIDSLTFLDSNELILGFSDDWIEGRVELVLHPFAEYTSESIRKLKNLLNRCGVNPETINAKSYADGPTFISVKVERSILSEVAQFNPLRTAHPLQFNEFPRIRNIGNIKAPSAPRLSSKSKVIVGMFDGGINIDHELLKGVASQSVSLPTPELKDLVEHGTAVAGVLLYGKLNDYSEKDSLPIPTVTVESFRALPPSDSMDYDLYESIDLIEETVPTKPEINVYNISFGPRGPILDDHVSRFTFALDKLAKSEKVLFNVAVGNDGDLPTPLNRVQAPSDLVNGLGVGSFSYDSSSRPVRAEYSSIGIGREGCKVKPDIVAFGGDSQRPFHVIGDSGQKALTMGTSFSSPLVAGKAAELLGRCDDMNPLLARCLLIHTAQHPAGTRDAEFGYGMFTESLDDVLKSSNEHQVTVLFRSTLHPKHFAKLPIPVPIVSNYNARARITWTIALLTDVNSLNTDEYTLSCVDDVFYPHDEKYEFTKKVDGKEKTVSLNIRNEPEKVANLVASGWTQSSLPKTDSAKKPSESELRSQFLKWDTVVKKTITKELKSLHNPFLTLHAMNRNTTKDAPLEYAVAITIEIAKYQGNLYRDVLRQYAKLQPIRVRNVNEIMVSVS